MIEAAQVLQVVALLIGGAYKGKPEALANSKKAVLGAEAILLQHIPAMNRGESRAFTYFDTDLEQIADIVYGAATWDYQKNGEFPYSDIQVHAAGVIIRFNAAYQQWKAYQPKD